jgi:SAM-dependent methyltransferase
LPVPYSKPYFAQQRSGSRQSADVIAPICMELVSPASVVDVGCGVGTWLAAFAALGVGEVDGLDGAYIDRSLLEIPIERFHPTDLNQPLQITRTYDLAISLEVVEHLQPARGKSFVADLVSLAPVVLFSAAIPHQVGTSHLNEQWQDFWAELFREHGYEPRDCIRPRVWNDASVEPWYAQNTLLYVRQDSMVQCVASMPLRVVHPRIHNQRATPGQLPLPEVVQHIWPSTRQVLQRCLRLRR